MGVARAYPHGGTTLSAAVSASKGVSYRSMPSRAAAVKGDGEAGGGSQGGGGAHSGAIGDDDNAARRPSGGRAAGWGFAGHALVAQPLRTPDSPNTSPTHPAAHRRSHRAWPRPERRRGWAGSCSRWTLPPR